MTTSKNVLANDVEIKGSIKFSHDLIIDGKIEGEVQSDGALTVGENALIKGEIKTLTTQQAMSGWVIGLLPPVVAMFIFLVNPIYMEPLYKAVEYADAIMARAGEIAVEKGITPGKALLDHSGTDTVLIELACAERSAEVAFRKGRTDRIFETSDQWT